jgi:pimeloyl-ACP methyl ester carboxylesterase
VNEYPVFVPFEDDHLAAIITVPEGDPRGLAVLLPGGSAARSHRFQVWTRTAEQLAEHGVATVRMDYRGIGDSTGTLPVWLMSDPPVAQVLAVTRFAMHATGTDRVCVAGNCMGSLLALEVAVALPECVGGVLIRMPVLSPSAVSKQLERVRRWKLSHRARSSAFLRRAVARPLGNRKKRTNPRLQGYVRTVLERGELLLLYSEEDFTFNERVAAELERLRTRLPKDLRGRFELTVREGKGLPGLQSLTVQQVVIETVAGWIGDRLGVPLPGAGAEPGTNAASPPEPMEALAEPQ